MDVKDLVKRQFGRQAKEYTTSRSHAAGWDLARLLELLAPRGGERALDVATGTGHTALALAHSALRVVGVDITPEMLAEARSLAAAQGAVNVEFREGDAEALPFGDGVFDLVTCRRAPHHFTDIGRFLAEVARVLVPGGRFGLADQTAPDLPEGRDLIEAFERLRDPTHHEALSAAAWRAAIESAGLRVTHLEVEHEQRDVDEYLRVAGTTSSVRDEIYARIAAAPKEAREANGFAVVGGSMAFTRLRVIAVAVR